MILCEPLKEFQRLLPPLFAGAQLDILTGGGYRWRTLQNELSRGDAPRDMIIKQGRRKNLVNRDRFLGYWQAKLFPAEIDGAAAEQ